ncbi:MAG: N-acetylglucosamine-6-phosphate deacetylase [Elusimicrobiaceae bacterium]|nr:N-acetylglucosamine-6-phosphate deacetylase [Elusimicrobiaceae bacterium]
MRTIYKNANIFFNGKFKLGSAVLNNEVLEDFIFGEIKKNKAQKIIDLKDKYFIPKFVETHIHGAFGFGADGSAEDLLKLSKALFKVGVGAFCPTLYPSAPSEMIKKLKSFSSVMGKEKGARIIGFHLEGPFLSPQKPGVMKPSDIKEIDISLIEKLYKAANGKIVSITAAPELKNFNKLAAWCKKNKVLLQLGHTNASYKNMQKAFSLGAKHITHFFLAMKGFHHREPGAVGAGLINKDFSLELLADGHHILPEVLKLVFALKDKNKIVLITDSLTPSGLKKGLANGEKVIFKNGVFVRKEDGVIAGSALSMQQGVKNLIAWNIAPEVAFLCATQNPAKLFNASEGVFKKGKKISFNIFDKNFNLVKI